MLPSWSVNDTVRPKVKPPHWKNPRERLVEFSRVVVLHVVGLERPQRAVGSLRPGVDREAATMPGRVVADRAVLRTAGTGIVRRTSAGNVVTVVGPDIAREPDTGVGTGDVIEPVSIERADLHVLDRLGLDGKIGGLRPGDRDHTGRGTEEKTFHHLHFEPPSCRSWEGSVSAGCFAPWKVPFSPRDRLAPKNLPEPDGATLGCPPPSHAHINRAEFAGNEQAPF